MPERPPSIFHSLALDIFFLLELPFKPLGPWPYVPCLYDFEVVGSDIRKEPRQGRRGEGSLKNQDWFGSSRSWL